MGWAARAARATAAVAASCLVAAGCTGGHGDPAPTDRASASAPVASMPSGSPTPSPSPSPSPSAYLSQAGVSAGHPAAVDAGVAMLNAGGNAVDAVIAAAFADSVLEPYASGIGGGGTALVVPTDPRTGRPQAYDYREVVPDDGVVPASRTGIPGYVAGMAALHADHGTLPWADLLGPAARLAREGHPVSGMLAAQLRSSRGAQLAARHPELASGGTPLSEGEPLVQLALADTLATLANDGPRAFYTGSLAAGLTGAGIDGASLAGYEIARGQPVEGPVGGYRLLAAMPPLPGAAVVQLLQVAEALGVAGFAPESAELSHALAAAWGVAQDTMDTRMGDPAFVYVPVEELTDPVRNAGIARALPAAAPDVQSAPAAAAGNTTHVSVVDRDGLTVSMTNTITSFWGSGVSVGGFFLNDHLRRFDDIGSTGNNEPAPGRRTASWMTPCVLTDGDGRPVVVLGTPGGRQIPTIVAGVIARRALLGQSLQDAVSAPRAHAEGRTLYVEASPPPASAAALARLGYTVDVVAPEQYFFGSVQALEIDHAARQVTGARDDRREGAFAVVEP